jgi:GNAT superfamily N-acetyltransferase
MITGYQIVNTSPKDLDIIYRLFEEAIIFQKKNNYIGWTSYDKDYIKADVENGLLFKMTTTNNVLCIFSICYNDRLIWREREKGDALYLHRLVLNQMFKGEKVFGKVLNWAIELARMKQLRFVRIDTWADNEKIISYYKSYGFRFIENYTTPNTENLPVQHRNLNVALLQLSIEDTPHSWNNM